MTSVMRTSKKKASNKDTEKVVTKTRKANKVARASRQANRK